MVVVLVVLLLVFTGYYTFRFGYYLKSFDTGDRLYFKDTGRYLGRIVQKDENHNFGSARAAAFLVTTDGKEEIWFPVGDIRSLCEKR